MYLSCITVESSFLTADFSCLTVHVLSYYTLVLSSLTVASSCGTIHLSCGLLLYTVTGMCCRIAIDYNSCFMLFSSWLRRLFLPRLFAHFSLNTFSFNSLQLFCLLLFFSILLSLIPGLSHRSLPIAFSVTFVSVSPQFLGICYLCQFFISQSAHMTGNGFCKRHGDIYLWQSCWLYCLWFQTGD